MTQFRFAGAVALAAGIALATSALTTAALAQKKYDTGASDKPNRLVHAVLLSGRSPWRICR